MFLYGQCIVSYEDFQLKILNWSPLFLLSLSTHTGRAVNRVQKLWKLSISSEAAVQRCYVKIFVLKVLASFQENFYGEVM